MKLCIVPHACPSPAASLLRRAEAVAEEIRGEHPGLSRDEIFRPLRPSKLGDGPSLHLDDLAEIPLLDRFHDPSFLETRARLRAVDGDFVASCTAPIPGYEEYCEHRLGLGSVTWLRPRPRRNILQVASACWRDRQVRGELLRAMREERLRYVHPHLGSHNVWGVSLLLREASGRPLSVIAPPPALCDRVNDKLWFAAAVRRLFGSEFVPRPHHAESYATAAHLIRWLSKGSKAIALKIPDSAGGRGNLVLPPERFRGQPIGRIRTALRGILSQLDWEVGDRLLVGTWESNVLCAPSAQLWIPPEEEGLPVVEGLFLQAIGADLSDFQGSRPAHLPAEVTDNLLERCWLLARMFQRLDYVGRCSFDMLLVGESLEDGRLEFLECNGRWGGTSTPMTLMNRLFGDWVDQPYAAHMASVPGLERLQFTDLLEHFAGEVYDAGTGSGSIVLYGPGRMPVTSGIDVLAMADDWDHASRRVQEEIPDRIADLVHARAVHDALKTAFLEDHQILTRGLNGIRAAVEAQDLDRAKRQAVELDAAAGAHIEFEEGFFYPELRRILDRDFVDGLYDEHQAGKRALEALMAGRVAGDDLATLKRDLQTAVDHVLSCGSLLSHLQALPIYRQAELLAELRTCRARNLPWSALQRPEY